MANYALIDENNIVTNVIAWDGVQEYTPPDGIIIVQSAIAGRGYIYDPDLKTFTNPNIDKGD